MHPPGPAARVTTEVELQALLELSPDAVVVVDGHGTIRTANTVAGELFGRSVPDLLGTSVDLLLPAGRREQHAHDRGDFHAAPTARPMGTGRDLMACRADGTTFPVDISLQPIEVNGEVMVASVVRDRTLTERLRSERQQFEALAAALDRFIDLASHELRTPLTAVRGFAETALAQAHGDPALRRQLLGRIVTNADRLEQVLQGLLQAARLRTGQVELHPETVRLEQLLAPCADEADDVELVLESPAANLTVDTFRLQQIVTDLVANARRYGAPPIRVEAAVRGAHTVIRVVDHGAGVESSFVPRMFEAFAQSSTGDTRDSSGLGLGLFLIDELITVMGGAIRYGREDDSRTVFTLSLPTVGPRRGLRPAPSPTGEHTALERILLDLAVQFVNVPVDELDAAIHRTLRRIGELRHASRTYLFTYDWEGRTCTNTHEWCAPGVVSVKDDLVDVDVSDLHEWLALHGAGRTVYRPDAHAASVPAAERVLWEAQGVTALITVPLMVDGTPIGFVGLDATDGPRAWSSRDRESLVVLGELLAQAQQRLAAHRIQEAALELERVNRELAGFAGAVSHDLKAPLTTIRGVLETFGSERVTAPQGEELRRMALAAVDRQSRMIDELLALASRGERIGARTPIELGEVVDAACEQLHGVVRQRDAEIQVGPLPQVYGDRLRLVAVFQNLIGNAIAHCPADRIPRVRVHADLGPDAVTVSVADNGDGVPPDARAGLLAPFARGATSTGSGLGLALCAQIIDAHDGTLSFDDADGGGLLVRVRLPHRLRSQGR